MRASHQTIDSYPDDWIHTYTDGSAFKATTKAGYGVLIQYPDGSSDELSEACGEICSNYEAEITAIEAALYHLGTVFSILPHKACDMVIFTDSMSLLRALQEDNYKYQDLSQVLLEVNNLIEAYGIKVIMQWIPGHSNTPGNDRADILAKRGSRREQPHTATSIQTAKHILKSNYREEWMNGWAMGTTGRTVFSHMNAPNPNDNINLLPRGDQVIIFRLRTQHIPLNKHLNRIKSQHPPMCPLCDHPYETVNHHLFGCPALCDIRAALLPPNPDPWNTLYSSKHQLSKTCRYHRMALARRARAQELLDR